MAEDDLGCLNEGFFVFTGGELTKTAAGIPTSTLEMKGRACERFGQKAIDAKEMKLKDHTPTGEEETRIVANAYLDTVNMTPSKRKKDVCQPACCCRFFIPFPKKSKAELDPAWISTPKSYKPADESYVNYTPEQF